MNKKFDKNELAESNVVQKHFSSQWTVCYLFMNAKQILLYIYDGILKKHISIKMKLSDNFSNFSILGILWNCSPKNGSTYIELRPLSTAKNIEWYMCFLPYAVVCFSSNADVTSEQLLSFQKFVFFSLP